MRRKVIQDFANVFCQRIIQLPNGYDLASFVYYGSGEYRLNILTGECSHDSRSIPKLRTCDEFKDWLFNQSDKHHIPRDGIVAVSLTLAVGVSQIQVGESYGHEFASAHFSFDCQSEIRTDEKPYTANMVGEQAWGFDWYYDRLYGSVLKLAGTDVNTANIS